MSSVVEAPALSFERLFGPPEPLLAISPAMTVEQAWEICTPSSGTNSSGSSTAVSHSAPLQFGPLIACLVHSWADPGGRIAACFADWTETHPDVSALSKSQAHPADGPPVKRRRTSRGRETASDEESEGEMDVIAAPSQGPRLLVPPSSTLLGKQVAFWAHVGQHCGDRVQRAAVQFLSTRPTWFLRTVARLLAALRSSDGCGGPTAAERARTDFRLQHLLHEVYELQRRRDVRPVPKASALVHMLRACASAPEASLPGHLAQALLDTTASGVLDLLLSQDPCVASPATAHMRFVGDCGILMSALVFVAARDAMWEKKAFAEAHLFLLRRYLHHYKRAIENNRLDSEVRMFRCCTALLLQTNPATVATALDLEATLPSLPTAPLEGTGSVSLSAGPLLDLLLCAVARHQSSHSMRCGLFAILLRQLGVGESSPLVAAQFQVLLGILCNACLPAHLHKAAVLALHHLDCAHSLPFTHALATAVHRGENVVLLFRAAAAVLCCVAQGAWDEDAEHCFFCCLNGLLGPLIEHLSPDSAPPVSRTVVHAIVDGLLDLSAGQTVPDGSTGSSGRPLVLQCLLLLLLRTVACCQPSPPLADTAAVFPALAAVQPALQILTPELAEHQRQVTSSALEFWSSKRTLPEHRRHGLRELRLWNPEDGDARHLYRLSASCLVGCSECQANDHLLLHTLEVLSGLWEVLEGVTVSANAGDDDSLDRYVSHLVGLFQPPRAPRFTSRLLSTIGRLTFSPPALLSILQPGRQGEGSDAIHHIVHLMFAGDPAERSVVRPNATLALQFLAQAVQRMAAHYPSARTAFSAACRRHAVGQRVMREGLHPDLAPKDPMIYWTYMVDLLQCLLGVQVLTVPILVEEQLLSRLDQLVGQATFWQEVQAGNIECLELIGDLLVTVLQWYSRSPDAVMLETVKVSRGVLLQVVPLLSDARAYSAVQSVVHGACQVPALRDMLAAQPLITKRLAALAQASAVPAEWQMEFAALLDLLLLRPHR
eukprot:GGOE01015194.1.p1 GENE.GGOE01015194.1~~GGOE01015194.1.p1  ORF type:complete len:1012 (-),score=243.50 GGOE01015194.1:236-3235(-)